MKSLSPNGKQGKLGALLEETQKKLNEQTEINIPKLEKDYAAELITSEELEKGYDKIIEDVLDLQKQLEQIVKKSTKQEKRIENLSIDMKVQTNDLRDNFERIEKDTKLGLKETLAIKQATHDNTYELRNIKRTVESHALKLNATSKMGGAWQLNSDEDKYPILKNEKYNHWSKYNGNLKDIVLEGDNLIDLKKFWNAMNTAFTSTLNANTGLEEYEDIMESYSIKDHLVPPLGHTQRNQGLEAYKNFTRVLRDHLVKESTIDKVKCPKAFKCLTRHLLNNDGFVILLHIIRKGSPQLGGDERDLSQFVDSFAVQDGEELMEFFHRAKKMEYEIKLQQDQTGQQQRLTRRFLQQLQRIPEYKLELGDIAKSIKRFFQKSTWITADIPFSIDDMLEELEMADVVTTMIVDAIPDPITNAGRAGREEYLKQQKQRERRTYLPRDEYFKKQREKCGQDKGHVPRKDCTCEACGYSTRELHKLLNDLHTGNPKECPLRGPKFNNDKQTRERINQYNLKNKGDKRVEVSEERLSTPPQRPTIPKTNHLNVNFADGYELEKGTANDENSLGDEEDVKEYEYDDAIEREEYDEEGMLPQPTVSSLRRKNIMLPRPITNQSTSQNIDVKENMNVISSFRLKQE